MGMTMEQTRPCTISESIIQFCKEMKSMREGRMPKRFLSELFENIEKWSKEEKEQMQKLIACKKYINTETA